MKPESPIKAVAIDLDGTLLTTDKKITPLTLAVLQAVMDRGVHVAIATGRSLATSIRFTDQVGTTFPMICYNGSCIWDPVTGNDLMHIRLSHEICTDIVTISRETHTHLHAFMDHDLLFTESGRHADHLEPLSAVIGKAVEFEKLPDLHFTKAMFIGEADETERLRQLLVDRYGTVLHLVYSHHDYFEIMTGGATKGSALQTLMGNHGIRREEVMAFGDADNDIEMLSWAGRGYAMENSSDQVKSYAYGAAGHNDADGVAKKLIEVFDLAEFR